MSINKKETKFIISFFVEHIKPLNIIDTQQTQNYYDKLTPKHRKA